MENRTNQISVAAQAVMPNMVPHQAPAREFKNRRDFIRHPTSFPLAARRKWSWNLLQRKKSAPAGDIGLSFVSRKYVPTGTAMELSIPLRGEVQKFHGRVVLVKEIRGGYEIGIWLDSADEASRVRLVEQICHLECRLQRHHTKAAATRH